MRHRNHHYLRDKEHHPGLGVGMFFIVLGLALLVAMNDLLNLGSVSSYFTWETALIFIGTLLLLNLRFTGGLLLIAAGVWFLKDRIFILPPEVFKTFFWPAVIVIIGLSFILSSFFKQKN